MVKTWLGAAIFSCPGGDATGRPGPGQQFVDAVGGMFSDAGEDVGQPGLGIDVIQLGCDDEPVEDGGALAACG
jgi:hypothetical protein